MRTHRDHELTSVFDRLNRMKIFLASLILIAWILGACTPVATPEGESVQSDAPVDETLTLIDGLDREVELPGPAQRILSMAPNNTEILFAIGAGDQVIGRDELSDFPPEAIEVPSIGSTYGELNTEAIVALEPDLVLAADITSPEQIQAIEGLGLQLFMLPNPMSFGDLFENIRVVGQLTGHESEAFALTVDLEARVQSVIERVSDVEKETVYFEVDGTDASAPWTVGAATFQDMMINLAGGENIAASIEGWAQINLEELVVQDPAVMLFSSGLWVPTTIESVSERAGWAEISAVVNGRVYAIDTNWVDRTGPRLVDAFESIAVAIHPDLFGP